MPAKNMSIPLPRYMSPVRRKSGDKIRVSYKYQRDVPEALRGIIGGKKEKKRWDLSLGSDLTTATAKCAAYTA